MIINSAGISVFCMYYTAIKIIEIIQKLIILEMLIIYFWPCIVLNIHPLHPVYIPIFSSFSSHNNIDMFVLLIIMFVD